MVIERQWLAVTAFDEPIKGGNQSFRAADPLVVKSFAGIETRAWRSVRKVEAGETEDDLFAFLTCPPNAKVQPIQPKAMPVICATATRGPAQDPVECRRAEA